MKLMVLLIIVPFIGLFISPIAGNEVKNDKKVFCYYESDSQYRRYPGTFLPSNIDPTLCTHIIFAFVNVTDNVFEPINRNHLGPRGLYARTVSLKSRNPDLKVLLSVGGWVADYEPFREAVSTQTKMAEFAANAIDYLRRHSLDGLDMDWEFPGSRESPPEDKWKFTIFMRTIHNAFKSEATRTGLPKLILTLASAVGETFIYAGYETRVIHRHVDYMLLMAYNFHGGWGNVTGHHSPILPHHLDRGEDRFLCQAWAVNFWLHQGVPKEKMILGMATYGMSFTLEDPSQNGVNVSVLGGGDPGPVLREAGVLAYYEICDLLRDPEAKKVWIEEQFVPYVTIRDQWVGYDDVISLKLKVDKLIHGLGLAGAFIWSVELDDFNGYCGSGRFPLLKAINDAIKIPHPKPSNDLIYPSLICEKLGPGIHNDVTSCHRYFYCLSVRNGGFSQYVFWCPQGQSYDKRTGYCVNRFECL